MEKAQAPRTVRTTYWQILAVFAVSCSKLSAIHNLFLAEILGGRQVDDTKEQPKAGCSAAVSLKSSKAPEGALPRDTVSARRLVRSAVGTISRGCVVCQIDKYLLVLPVIAIASVVAATLNHWFGRYLRDCNSTRLDRAQAG
jgi:hypothetical protein